MNVRRTWRDTVAEIRSRHHPDDRGECGICEVPWPCPISRSTDELEKVMQDSERTDRALTWVAYVGALATIAVVAYLIARLVTV